MRLTQDEVRHVAELAKLRLTEAETEEYTGQLSAILDYAAVIQEVDTSWQLLQEITTQGIGYIVRRATLYGPPPPYAE